MANSQSIQQLTECPIHIGPFERPKVLPCQHTFCEVCLKKYQNSSDGQLRCPTCRKNYGEIDTSKLPNDYTIMALLEASMQHNCTCVEGNSFCTDCLQLSCQICSETNHTGHNVLHIQGTMNTLTTVKTALKEEQIKVEHLMKKLADNIATNKEKVQRCREIWISMVNTICDASLSEIDNVTAESKELLKKQSIELSSIKRIHSEAEELLELIRDPHRSDKAVAWAKLKRAIETSIPKHSRRMENCGVEFKEYDNVIKTNLQKAGDVSVCSVDPSKSVLYDVSYNKKGLKEVVVKLKLRDGRGQDVISGGDVNLEICKPDSSGGGCGYGGGLCKRKSRYHIYEFRPKSTGTYRINASVNQVHIHNSPKELVIKPVFDQSGFKFGQEIYYGAHDIVRFEDELFITDKYNHRIVVIDKTGKLLREFSINETHMDGHFEPFGITVSKHGLLYITDMKNHEVFVCDIHGNVQQRIGKKILQKPNGIVLTKTNEIIVVDYDDCCLYMFENNGRYKCKFGSPGKDFGQFLNPWFIAVNSKGHWIVSDCGNRRLQIFDGADTFRLINSVSVGYHVRGIVIDSEDNIIITVVIDNAWLKRNYGHVVKMYKADGKFLGDISREHHLVRPRGMCITEDSRGVGILIVTDDSNALHKYEMI